MDVAKQSDISDFLYKFKFFAQDLKYFSFIKRGKNMQSLADLGITIPQAINIILRCNVAKCISFHKADFAISYPYKNGG